MAMKCAFCGVTFEPRRVDAVCCSSKCSTAYKNLEMTRAKAVYRALYHWRADRKGPDTADNLRFITREIREWIDRDKAAGRPPPPKHDHMANRGQQAQKRGTAA